MEVSPPSGSLAGWIHLDALACTHHANQCPLGEYLPAAHTGALGHMLNTLNWFLSHLSSQSIILPIFPFLIAAFVLLDRGG